MGQEPVLAAMTLWEGTCCWRLVDVRLALHRVPSPYSGGCFADDFCDSLKPETEELALLVKSMLREYTETQGGMILWCTFNGIVRGKPAVNGYTPVTWAGFDQAGWWSRKDGLAYLKKTQAFWESFEGNLAVKIHNPHHQPSSSEIRFQIGLKLSNEGKSPAAW